MKTRKNYHFWRSSVHFLRENFPYPLLLNKINGLFLVNPSFPSYSVNADVIQVSQAEADSPRVAGWVPVCLPQLVSHPENEHTTPVAGGPSCSTAAFPAFPTERQLRAAQEQPSALNRPRNLTGTTKGLREGAPTLL